MVVFVVFPSTLVSRSRAPGDPLPHVTSDHKSTLFFVQFREA